MTTARRRIRFRITLIGFMLTIVAAMLLATLAAVVQVADGASSATARQLFASAATAAESKLETVLGEALIIADAVAATPVLGAIPRDDGLDHPALPVLIHSVESFPRLYSAYVGYDDGSFMQVINADGDRRITDIHDAPTATRFIVRTITSQDDARIERWTFLAHSGAVLGRRAVPDPAYDPRARPWFESASDAGATLSDPYVFNSLQEPGITASRRLAAGPGIFGVDITLDALNTFIDTYEGVPLGGLIIIDAERRIVATGTEAGRLVALPAGALQTAPESITTIPESVTILGGPSPIVAVRRPWSTAGVRDWQIAVIAPVSAFTGPFEVLQRDIVVIGIVLLALIAPLILLASRSMTRVLARLAADADQVAQLDFSVGPPIHSRIEEFHRLSSGFGVMKEAIRARTEALETTLARLERLTEITIAVSAERDFDRLLERIVEGARELTNAAGGALYTAGDDDRLLVGQILRHPDATRHQGGTSATAITLAPVDAATAAIREGAPRDAATHLAITFAEGTTRRAADDHALDAAWGGTVAASALYVPLNPRGASTIGVLQLVGRVTGEAGDGAADAPTDEREDTHFDAELQRLIEALGSAAATALQNRHLLEVQKRLFDALIELIAGAIDTKSAYTGGHCARVPEIAMMLAEEAERQRTGPFQSFTLGGESDWRAFRLGAWLHDAGKVTTPEYVVDKATKLETLYDRIHEIRTRFEVLLRDARIASLEAVVAGQSRAEAEATYARTAQVLADEFAFIAAVNEAARPLGDTDAARLREIAGRRWQRHFDDGIGISWAEQQRRGDAPAASITAPVEETLIADRPVHRVHHDADPAAAYGDYAFTLPVPALQYNRGELYNLLVPRGTLTTEERFRISEHVMQTIVMLDRLPLPPELRRITEYAGTHHEALDGSGYPRGLAADDLSIPARIMAIADIFEALSASDRPYKRAKPLSVVLGIMREFRDAGHIDPDLFDLFLTSGVYRRYAERHLRPEQLDDVDIDVLTARP